MSTLSLTATLVNRWKAWGKHENRRTTPSVPTQKRWYMLTLLMLLGASLYVADGMADDIPLYPATSVFFYQCD